MFQCSAKHLLGFLVLLTAGLTGCSKDLSRSRAADLIKQHKDFGAVIDVRVPVGNVWYDWRNVESDYKPLQDHGILTIREAGQKMGMWSKEYLLELTPRGKDLSKSWLPTKDEMPGAGSGGYCWTDNSDYSKGGPPCHKASGTVYSIVLARRELNEVTGITAMEAGGKMSLANFSWEWVPTTDVKDFPDRFPAGVQKGEAGFQLYDDGWRIAEIAFH
jgi:hypothetical protein